MKDESEVPSELTIDKDTGKLSIEVGAVKKDYEFLVTITTSRSSTSKTSDVTLDGLNINLVCGAESTKLEKPTLEELSAPGDTDNSLSLTNKFTVTNTQCGISSYELVDSKEFDLTSGDDF